VLKKFLTVVSAGLCLVSAAAQKNDGTVSAGPWIAGRGDGTYINPVLFSDYSDPDVIRVGGDYYLTASSFQETPGLPILHSYDLVNWKIVGFGIDTLPSPAYDKPQYGDGVWAPSLRYRNGEFFIYYGDPDAGIFVVKAKNPSGPWQPSHLVKAGKGLIDPCPLWDDDGNAYVVHAWAKSRCGFNSVLSVFRLSADGMNACGEDSLVFDGRTTQPTIEGPKFYKREGFYYIFAPAGGVKPGWQTVLKSKNPFGPYEERIVMDQGSTSVNGPHQGGWVRTQTGEDWFMHFQDRSAYGRIVHLEPMKWNGEWPVIGICKDGSQKGEPVAAARMPDVGTAVPKEVLQTSDEFDSTSLGLQWQWNANHKDDWYSLAAHPGYLRLFSRTFPEDARNLRGAPNIIVQKIPAPVFSAEVFVSCEGLAEGNKFGLVVFGTDYSSLVVERKGKGLVVSRVLYERENSDSGGKEVVLDSVLIAGNECRLRVSFSEGARCRFSCSAGSGEYSPLGGEFKTREGKWIGARIGMFCAGFQPGTQIQQGFVDIDWIRFH
jgi:beta-xylosidase